MAQWTWERRHGSPYYVGCWTCGADHCKCVAIVDDFGNLVVLA